MSSSAEKSQQVAPPKSNGDVISPQIPSGVAPRIGIIAAGMGFLTIIYVTLYWFLQDSSFVTPAKEFCSDDEEPSCTRPDLFGFQVSSGIMMVFMGVTGFRAWHWTKTAHQYDTPEGRCFGYIQDAADLNTGIFIFQAWDFLASLFIPEHATAIFLTHHVLAGMTALFSLEYQMVHHYAIFFGGCSEISSIFLVICDFDVYFPATKAAEELSSSSSSSTIISIVWGTIVFVCQASFAIAFFYYRIVGWWINSYRLWMDVMYVTQTKNTLSGSSIAQQYRPGTWWFIYVFLTMDLLLGLLQVYWFGFGIVPKILEILES